MTHPLHTAWRDSEATEAASDALNRALTQGDAATNQRAREMREALAEMRKQRDQKAEEKKWPPKRFR